MADISLLFDVQREGGVGQGSEATIRAQLQEIVNSINSKPFKIQFEADTSTLRKQVEDAVGSTSSSNKRKSNSNKTSQEYRDATKAIDKYYTKLRQLSLAEKEAFDTYNETGEINTKYSRLVAELDRLKTAYDNARASADSMSVAEQENIKFLDDTRQIELAASIEHRTNAVLQNNAALTSSQTILNQANATLERCTKAENSHKQSSRDAFNAIKQKMEAVIQARSAVEAGSATDEGAARNVRLLQEAERDLRRSLKENYATIQQNGDATKTLGERMSGLAKKFTSWFSVSQTIMAAYRAIKQMISSVIELDTAMTELKKVTDETDATYDKFLNNAAARAKTLGASLTDVVKTSADFARLGLTLEDAEAVSDAALVYKNVGDGIRDIDQASESIISTMQAFDIEASNAISIVDKFNMAGNKFAISSGGIGDALLNSAAALSAAGNSLDQSIGLITAANTTIQNPESVGTALKTISMYLRAAKTDAEAAGESTDGMASSVSELRNEILSLTGKKVDIQIDNDTFKDTFEVFRDLSKVWDDLTDTSRANITELIGGKRNTNVISAIIKNFEIAERAVTETSESAGSALEENAKVLDSIQGKINILKATFQELSSNFVDSGIVKAIVDFGTGIMSTLNWITKAVDAIGGLKTLLLGLASVLMITQAGWVANNVAMIKNLIMTKLTTLIQGLVSGFKNLGYSIINAVAQWKLYSLRVVSASSAMQASIPVIGLVLAAITALVGGLSLYSSKLDERRQKEIEAGQAAKEDADSLEELIKQYKELREASTWNDDSREKARSIQEQITNLVGAQADNLDLVNGKLDDEIKKLNTISSAEAKNNKTKYFNAKKSAEEELTKKAHDNWAFGQENSNVITGRSGFFDPNFTDENEAIKSALNNVGLNYSKFNNGFVIDTSSAESIINSYEDMIMLQDHLVQNYAKQISKGGLLEDFYNNLTTKINHMTEAVNNYKAALSNWNQNEAVIDMGKYLKENDINSQGSFDKYINSIKNSTEYSEGYKAALIELANNTFPEYCNAVEEATNKTNNAADSFVSSISKIQSLEKGFGQLDKIYADIFNGEDFDFGSILSEDFKATFGNLGEDYNNFIKTIANSPNDISACQTAFNNLANAYLNNSDALKGVTDETRDVTVAMLEQMGVANAATIVDQQLAYNKLYLKYATEEYVKKGYEEVYASYKKQAAGSLEQKALAKLALEKARLNKIKINKASDIKQLIEVARAADVTTQSISLLGKALEYQSKVDLYTSKAKQSTSHSDKIHYMNDAKKYAKLVAEIMASPLDYNRINYKDIQIDFDGGSATKSAKEQAAKEAASAAKEAASAAKEAAKQETWFEKEYKKQQHLVAINKKTEKAYLTWLESAYKKAYDQGILTLDDYYQYQEEVYEGLQNLFKDSIEDIQHEISMRENYEGESKHIIPLYKKIITAVEKEIAAARAKGLGNSSEYIQDLQSMWQEAVNGIREIEDSAKEAAKNSLKELVDYRVDMIKQEYNEEKDSLNKRLDNIRDFYDKQKEMLQDKYDEEKYLEEQSEKRKSITDIQSEIISLEIDDSAWAQKRKLELQEELKEAQKDLKSFEDDHSLELALETLDDAHEAREKEIEAQMDALDELLNDPHTLFNQALCDIKNNTGGLYKEMIEYNRAHGSGDDNDVKDLYENVYKELLNFKTTFGYNYEGISLPNSTSYKSTTGTWGTTPVSREQTSGSTTSGTSSTSYPYGKASEVSGTVREGAKGTAVKAIQYALNKLGYGNSGTASLDGNFGANTKSAVIKFQKAMGLTADGVVGTNTKAKFKAKGYATGTKSATPGLHRVDEEGFEQVFVSSNGNRYRMLNAGDKVFNADATNFLYDFAKSKGNNLFERIEKTINSSLLGKIQRQQVVNSIEMGNIIIQGNANEKTVSEIRRAQRDSVDFMLKEFIKLNK